MLVVYISIETSLVEICNTLLNRVVNYDNIYTLPITKYLNGPIGLNII